MCCDGLNAHSEGAVGTNNKFVFLAVLVAWLYGWQCQSVSRSNALVDTKIPQQLLNWFPLNIVEISVVTRE